MKKLLILFMLILSSPLLADSIPGWLELDVNAQEWNGIGRNKGFGNAEMAFKYGGQIYQFKPYIMGGMLTYFNTGHNGYNAPFRDIYTAGMGIKIYDVLYIEYIHKCAHFVRTTGNDANRLYETLPGTAHNIFKIGLKFKID